MGVLDGSGLDPQQLCADGHGGLPRQRASEPMNSVLSFSTPIGVMTAAVPQAKTSAISPEATPSRHSSRVILRSVTFAAHVLGDLDHGGAGDALQDGAAQRGGDERAVLHHEEDVHAAELLDPLVVELVQEEDLVAALGLGLLLGDQRRGVVAAALGGAGAAAAGAGVFAGEPDGHGLEPPPK